MIQSTEIKNENKAIEPKYKLGGTKTFNGRTLFRVIALRSFSDVMAGDIGGWVETEDNLAQDGDAWVYDDAMVYDGARVSGNAVVLDHAIVFGNSMIYDNAMVFDNAVVYGNAMVYDYAMAYCKARVYGNARVFGKGLVKGKAQVYGNAIATKAVNTMHTDAYNITIIDNYITIGFENHPIADWEAFTDEQIADMDTGALAWWKVWKPIIFAIINAY
jgi:carbonic anhydrase/acetyltransferase-like protein (isoleucine patch superfamily)